MNQAPIVEQPTPELVAERALLLLRAHGVTARIYGDDPSVCYSHYVSLAMGEACPDCLRLVTR